MNANVETDIEKTTSLYDYINLLQKNKIYRTLFIAYCIDNCGNWLTFVACINIIDQLEVQAIDTSLFLICRLLPSILFASILGPIADRYNKLNLLIMCSLGSAISVFVMVALLSLVDNFGRVATLSAMCTLTFMQFTFSALYEPVRDSLLPTVVSDTDLIAATSLDGLAWSVVGALGAATGGYVNSLLGSKISFGLDVTSYIICAYWIYSLKGQGCTTTSESKAANEMHTQSFELASPNKDRILPEKNEVIPDNGDCKAAVKYLLKFKFVLLLCLIKGAGSILWGVAAVIAVRISEMDQFLISGDESVTLGIIFAFEGIGCQIGPLLWNTCTPQKEQSLLFAVMISFIQMGLSYVLMAFSQSIGTILMLTAVRSMGSSVVWIYSTLLLQLEVERSLQGRVFALEQAICVVCEIASILLGGFFFDRLKLDFEQACRVMGIMGASVSLFWITAYGLRYHCASSQSRNNERVQHSAAYKRVALVDIDNSF